MTEPYVLWVPKYKSQENQKNSLVWNLSSKKKKGSNCQNWNKLRKMSHKKAFWIFECLCPKRIFNWKKMVIILLLNLKKIKLFHIALNINIINLLKSQLLPVVFQMRKWRINGVQSMHDSSPKFSLKSTPNKTYWEAQHCPMSRSRPAAGNQGLSLLGRDSVLIILLLIDAPLIWHTKHKTESYLIRIKNGFCTGKLRLINFNKKKPGLFEYISDRLGEKKEKWGTFPTA